MGIFGNFVRQFLSPDKAQLNLGALKLEYSDDMRTDVSKALATIQKKRVLFASIEHEIWQYVFESLKELLDELATLSGSMKPKGPKDVKSAVSYLVDIIRAYLEEYETDYIRFMQSGEFSTLAPAHKERNWLTLGRAASDLVILRKLIHATVENLNLFAEEGKIIDWEEPEHSAAEFWVQYAEGRRFCTECGVNLYYSYKSYDGKCPSCFKTNSTFSFHAYQWKDKPYPKSISLTGNFNNWENPGIPFNSVRYQFWELKINLPKGRNEYKFIIDGEWITDPNNKNIVVDSEGNENSYTDIS